MPSNPRDAKQPIKDESGSESYSGKKIPWPEEAVWVRVPPAVQLASEGSSNLSLKV